MVSIGCSTHSSISTKATISPIPAFDARAKSVLSKGCIGVGAKDRGDVIQASAATALTAVDMVGIEPSCVASLSRAAAATATSNIAIGVVDGDRPCGFNGRVPRVAVALRPCASDVPVVDDFYGVTGCQKT
ncbi:MAG: hypothetical protein CGW95_14980 [Phenylobacterium zucineum]|nr:MAG: hypothetical protein CGW95_14980 [Phenylobacterium zucineum]